MPGLIKRRFAAMLERGDSGSSPAPELGVDNPELSNERYLMLLGWQLLNRSRRCRPGWSRSPPNSPAFGNLAFSNIAVWRP